LISAELLCILVILRLEETNVETGCFVGRSPTLSKTSIKVVCADDELDFIQFGQLTQSFVDVSLFCHQSPKVGTLRNISAAAVRSKVNFTPSRG